jgi:rubrerythrin
MYDEEALKPLRQVLENAREQLDIALRRLKSLDELRCLRWRCLDCGYIKHFTRPMPAEVAPPCPKCAGKKFTAVT